MKLLKELNSDFDAIEIEKLEAVEISAKADPMAVLAGIGAVAHILIKICEVWKKLPGKNKDSRNLCLDRVISYLSIAGMISAIKFKK